MSSGARSSPPPSVVALLRMAWEESIEELVPALAAAGYADLRRSHLPIVRNMLLEGQRPGELATKLGLSKQAANDLLREFEGMGYVTLAPDPDDRRAKRIVVTQRGWALATTASELSSVIGRRWAEQVGTTRFAEFESVLREIVEEQARTRRPASTG